LKLNRFSLPLVVAALAIVLVVALGSVLIASGLVRDKAIEDSRPVVLVIPASAVEALDNYEFESELALSSGGGVLNARLQGAVEEPGMGQAVVQADGEVWERTGLPANIEFIVAEDRSAAWWREPDGQWHEADERAAFALFPLASYVSPRFYITALDFETLTIPATSADLNGTNVQLVRLDKAALVGMLDQGIFVKEAGKDSEIVREDAQAFLPEDIVVEAYLTETEKVPIRIVVELSVSEGEEAFEFGFDKPVELRLETNITDPDAGNNIETPADE
jgi:hypothetical protein